MARPIQSVRQDKAILRASKSQRAAKVSAVKRGTGQVVKQAQAKHDNAGIR